MSLHPHGKDENKFSASDFNLTQAAYSIDDFAHHAGIGRNSVYKAINRRELVLTKIGNRSLITAPDGAVFLNAARKSREKVASSDSSKNAAA